MGLLDREYMRAGGSGGGGAFRRRFAWQWTALRGLLAANVAAFFLFELAALAGDTVEAAFIEWLPLTTNALAGGRLWTVATYSLLHDNFWHFAGNMLALGFAGSALERLRGGRFLLTTYAGGVLAGGALWLVFAAVFGVAPVSVTGASGGVFAVLTALLLAWQRERIEFRLIFLPFHPFSLQRSVLLGVLGGLTAAGLLLDEVPALTNWWPILWDGGTSHLCHLGGMLFAVAAWWRVKNLERFPALRFRRRRVRPLRQIAAFRSPGNNAGNVVFMERGRPARPTQAEEPAARDDATAAANSPRTPAAPQAGETPALHTHAAAAPNANEPSAPTAAAIPPPPSRHADSADSENAAANAANSANRDANRPANSANSASDAAAARFSAIAADGRARRHPLSPAEGDANSPANSAARNPGEPPASRSAAAATPDRPPRPNRPAPLPGSRPVPRIGDGVLIPPRRQPESPLMREVNRILDKINATGIASLTPAEHDTLDRASRQFRR